MNDLDKAITSETEYHSAAIEGDEHHLNIAAQKWATHCLSIFRNDLLKKGLAISAALVDFTTELENNRF